MWSNASSELELLLSGRDAIKLLEIIHKTLPCDSEEELASIFPMLRELFSFECVNAALGRMDGENEVEMSCGFNFSFPEEWMREYLSRNYFQTDSVIRENFSTFKTQHWSMARKEVHRQKEITSLGMDFGIRECWTHGSGPARQEKFGSMFCFAGTSMKYDRRSAFILDVVIPHLHLALSGIFDKKRAYSERILLSDREKEVLDWLKQGKSSWEISVILGISERTVNFHVSNIMRKLGATNRAQSIAVAARLGLVDFE